MSRRSGTVKGVLFLTIILSAGVIADEPRSLERMGLPRGGRMYHGVYPGGRSGFEDDLTPDDLETYERLVGQRAAWVYFSNNWFADRAFPLATAQWIREQGAVPFIRLMLRSKPRKGRVEEDLFTLDAILAGEFDADLRKWAASARSFRTPLIVEWGTECNGHWFPWNGSWNGGGETEAFADPERPDGPERFVAAYRHIVTLIRGEGAANITWVFHPNHSDEPDEEWNRFEAYYPGDDVVDWIGVSAYGALLPRDKKVSLQGHMDRFVWRLKELAPAKPLVILEFGCAAGHNDPQRTAIWARQALNDILGRRWPQVIGFSWWNERWRNDDNPIRDTTMRVQDLPHLAREFRRALDERKQTIETRPVVIEVAPSEGT